MKYSDIDQRKKAFVFELDNVLYPEKDYIYQVYYLFANLLEYTDLTDAKATTKLMVDTYIAEGEDAVFDALVKQLNVDSKYKDNLKVLMATAKVPLKLLLYQNMLELLQEIVLDRKKIFIVTNGDPQKQLNKIKQIEWHGLDPYLTCYFANETLPKPEPDILYLLMKEHNMERRDIIMIENSDIDKICAETLGIDYINACEFL
ncbi:HAD family hydrolase [Mucilaginibacter segetis]|uniref:phosphoglycolate phosphatase n=1 Tax=Mucilaginibacter segetis TaxID=2793071 RepID=A0A934PU27_9SPHI|nr:HAD hydrolase-like protein [Mucilaginibacter segetis]MBK0379085.1 HAD family hydrolase [Mucilaginibacter segetis]